MSESAVVGERGSAAGYPKALWILWKAGSQPRWGSVLGPQIRVRDTI